LKIFTKVQPVCLSIQKWRVLQVKKTVYKKDFKKLNRQEIKQNGKPKNAKYIFI